MRKKEPILTIPDRTDSPRFVLDMPQVGPDKPWMGSLWNENAIKMPGLYYSREQCGVKKKTKRNLWHCTFLHVRIPEEST
ncbi:hypothetical protein TNCT_168471 [Trichonephila clavata]|uniref:Uncharacterized protein n=1 Tax=Trichonephila clavata TaxID=2740835 RepID=A0A8X6JSU1_TRICU|nr:hypothetical protein TNCT_168471 [Trichonephila clavata]